MFENLHLHAKSLHGEMVEIYWIMLPAVVAALCVFEALKRDGPNMGEIFRRSVISILLLLSFDLTVNTISIISDGITAKIGGNENVWQAIQNLGPNSQGEAGSLFDVREHMIYFFAIAAYLLAYIGFFASVALVNFVWAVLYVCAPLMLLFYVSPVTAPVVGNLYRSLVSVATWKILWTLLGSLLLKMAMEPNVVGIEDYFLSMVMNLLIGLSMLLVPFFAKSLIGDGLQSASSALAAAPGLVTAKAASFAGKRIASRAGSKAVGQAGFAAKPLTNPLTGRAKILSEKLKPRLERFKKRYGEANLPPEAKNIQRKDKESSV